MRAESVAGQSARCTDSSSPARLRVQLVGDERAVRREHQRDRDEALVQRRVRGGSDDFQKRGANGARTSSRGRRRTARAPARRRARRTARAPRSPRCACCERDRIHRSSTCVAAAVSAQLGRRALHPSRLRVGHEERVRVPEREQEPARRLVDVRDVDPRGRPTASPAENMYQRSASAPRVSSTVHGSMTLPRDFDIFWPSWSTM